MDDGDLLPCPFCSARLQENMDGDLVHARAGTYECPPEPVPEFPPEVLARLAGLANLN